VRDVDADVQRSTAKAVLRRAQEIAEARGVTIVGRVISDQRPVVLEAWPRALAHDECESLGLSYRVMSSGAGHDAAIVARLAPATMVFVPCAEGISHSPGESASPNDVAAAAALIGAIIRRADRMVG
jgi:acetylornithine deacetylase/succinyl-diaminopimelate desuccinylase-like protein